jgi:hypothetical protein
MLPPNELRIDAAEGGKNQKQGMSAGASIRVERSRTPEDTNQLEIKAQDQAGRVQPTHLLHQSIKELYMEKECFCRGKKP